MAEVTSKTTEITGVTLELSRDEAEFISVVMSKISGDPTDSPRRHQEPISGALRKAGVPFETTGLYRKDAGKGTIHFDNDKIKMPKPLMACGIRDCDLCN